MNEEQKPFWQSKTVIASLVVVVVSMLLTFGIVGSGDVDATEVTDHIWSIISGVAGLVAIIGRIVASKKIGGGNGTGLLPLLLLPLICFAGCSGVMLNSAYKTQLQQATAVTQELNVRCQNGDIPACQGGLELASDTLQLLLDASNGISGGGDN